MKCVFRLISENLYECETCGFNIKSDTGEQIHRRCNKPRFPSVLQQAKNLGVAVVKHVADGMRRTSTEEYASRLMVCQGDEATGVPACPFYQAGRCLECGCFLAEKAKWRSEDCPKDKWAKLE